MAPQGRLWFAVAMVTLVLALDLPAVLCMPSSSASHLLSEERVLMESRHIDPTYELPAEVHRGWKMGERAESGKLFTLTFALKYSDDTFKRIEDELWRVSDPIHEMYKNYFTLTELAKFIDIPQAQIDKLLEFISNFEVETVEIPTTRDFVKVTLRSEVAEEMLQCEYYYFSHVESATTYVRCKDGYSLPKSVADGVAFVSGTVRFPQIKKLKVSPDVGLVVDPNLIRSRYSVGDTVGTNPNNSQAVAQFLGQYYSQSDLSEFFDLFYPAASGNQPTVIGPNNGSPGTEASLDIEYIMSVGANISTQFWSNEEPSSNQEPFLEWMYNVNNDSNAAWVFSVSYGDDEDSRSYDYCTRLNAEFIKAGLRGLSILFAAGDSGVGGSFGACHKFVPDFPASSPYVTAVGGTALGLLESGEESVWEDGGGGFSNYFARPAYQDSAVENYLKNMSGNLPDQSKWNASGRAYPDVAALASGFIIVIDRIPTPGVAGTSCATPTFSAIISLVNDVALNEKGSLGFLNPYLYRLGENCPQVFTDITQGSNPGCGTNGFEATVGWDPASGWGSPVFDKLVTASKTC